MQLNCCCHPTATPPSSSEQYLRDLVYFTNGFHLPRNAVFGPPVAFEPHDGDPFQRDTSVVVTVEPGCYGGDTGQITLFYKRLILTDLTPSSTARIPAGDVPYLLSTLLPQINALYGTHLEASDIVDQLVQPGVFPVMQSSATSLAWQASLAVPVEYDLAAVTPERQFNGFDAETVLSVTDLSGFQAE